VTYPALQFFSTLSHKRHDYRKTLLNLKYVFWFSKNTEISDFIKILPGPNCSMGWTDGHTDMTKLVVAFLNLRKCLIKRRKVYWIGQFLHMNCPLKHVLEGKKRVQRRGRRHKQLLDNPRKREDTGIWKTKHYIAPSGKKIALETGYGSVARQTKHRIRILRLLSWVLSSSVRLFGNNLHSS